MTRERLAAHVFTLLVVAVVITVWLASVARRPVERPTFLHVAGATFGMLVWAGIIIAGRYIAYVD